MKITARIKPEMEQRIIILHNNFVSIYSKYDLILELGRYKSTILGESSLYKYIFVSFFKDIILGITRLFERYENRSLETVHLLWVLKKHKKNLDDSRSKSEIRREYYKN